MSHVQAKIYVRDAADLVRRTIARKDLAGNDVLAISTGLPDQSGFACAADGALLELAQRAVEAGEFTDVAPDHLKFVSLAGPGQQPVVLYHDEEAFPLP